MKSKTLSMIAGVALAANIGVAQAATDNDGMPEILGSINGYSLKTMSHTELDAVQGESRRRVMGQRKYGVSNRYGQHRTRYYGSHSRYKRR